MPSSPNPPLTLAKEDTEEYTMTSFPACASTTPIIPSTKITSSPLPAVIAASDASAEPMTKQSLNAVPSNVIAAVFIAPPTVPSTYTQRDAYHDRSKFAVHETGMYRQYGLKQGDSGWQGTEAGEQRHGPATEVLVNVARQKQAAKQRGCTYQHTTLGTCQRRMGLCRFARLRATQANT